MSKDNKVSVDELTGRDNTSLQAYDNYLLHKDVIEPFNELKHAAKKAGFDLSIASAYRNYERQLVIWNEKVTGKRPVLDLQGNVVDILSMDEEQLLFSLLHWSAIPGASRHHWGTDIDIYDAGAVDASYKVQLTDDEVCEGGVFSALHAWLDSRFLAEKSLKFYRPFTAESSCVAAEKWHISYRPVSKRFESMLSIELLRDSIASDQRLLLREHILKNLESIYSRYISLKSSLSIN